MIGGAGNDYLDGGVGDDKYFYYLADGVDTIDQTGGGNDVLWLMDKGITEDRIIFTKENNDLIVTIDNNSNQSIRVKDHFLGGRKQLAVCSRMVAILLQRLRLQLRSMLPLVVHLIQLVTPFIYIALVL